LAHPLLDARLATSIHQELSMWRLPISRSRLSAVSIVCLALPLVFSCVELFLKASPQSDRPRQNVHSLLSQNPLAPALRSTDASLRFSPDGNFLLFQDPSGVIVMTKDPLNIVLRISAEDIYPAQFSQDSRSVTIISRALNFGKWRLPAGQKTASGSLSIDQDCLDGQLSPGGEMFACIRSDFKLVLYQLSSQKIIFEDFIAGLRPSVEGHVGEPRSRLVVNFLWLDLQSAFARPFGLLRTSVPTPSPSHSLAHSAIHFSPDGKVLIAKSLHGSIGLDVDSKKRFELPDVLLDVPNEAIDLQSTEHAIAVEKESKKESSREFAILALKNGKALSRFSFTADSVRIATNSRYAILQNSNASGSTAAAFDLEQNHTVESPPSASLDIYAEQLAVYNISGAVALYRLGEHRLLANLPLPLARLSELHAASVTPDLEKLALSVDGAAAIFDVASGRRLASLAEFSSANSLDQPSVFLFVRELHQDPAHMLRFESSTGASSTAWTVEKDHQLYPAGTVLLDHFVLKGAMGDPFNFPLPQMQIPFRLRGVDPATGKELWKRVFDGDPPTPFADPQGDRFVLGWRVKTYGAKEAASHNPAAQALYKSAKLMDRDSFFEVLDARTGKSLGGELVQIGNGPTSFDSAFSVGDALILIKDGVRVTIYSLRDETMKAHLVGARASANSQNNLLAMDLGGGHLGIYDLNSGTKLDDQTFPDEIAYTHFSGDGKRLLVLTEHQLALVLDVSSVRESHGDTQATGEKK
jgi:hypothetical protein